MRNLVRSLVCGLFGLFVVLPAISQQVAKSIPNNESPDRRIGFLEFRPYDYGSQQHPLIIFLHGIGERGNGSSDINNVAANAIPNLCAHGATMSFKLKGKTSSFVVLSPQLSNQYGYWPTFYVKEMIKYAKANLQIDPNRIYITGLSLGGGGVWRVITDTYNWDNSFDASIAAAAPVCGTQEESDADFGNTIGANNLPVWAFHSMDDGIVNVGATQHAEILSKNYNIKPKPLFTYYQSGNHWGAWINAYDTGHLSTIVDGGKKFTQDPNLYEWFLSNSRSNQDNQNNQDNNTPPSVDAGPDQSVTLPNSSVTLNGNANGVNGSAIVRFNWTKKSGGNATIVNSGAAVTAINGLSAGDYVFTLTVTDNNGLSSSSDVKVTVKQGQNNQPPSVDAGADQSTTLPNNTVTLYGNANGVNGSSITSYNWTKKSGGQATIGNTGVAVTTVSNLTQGNYVFTLTVRDDRGTSASSDVNVTVNAAVNTIAPPNNGANPIGYVKQSYGSWQACADPSTSGRIAVYGDGANNGNLLYLDAARTKIFNGGWNWYSFTATFGGAVTEAFAIYPNGGIALMTYCANGQPSATPGYNPPVVPPPPSGGLLGYLKISTGPYQACDDASTSGRIAIYGTGIANGSVLYTDAGMTQKLNGGWNWYSITPSWGSNVTYAFAVYPIGSILLLRNCANGSGSRIAGSGNATSAEEDIATLSQLKAAGVNGIIPELAFNKMNIYPNPVRNTATISFSSLDGGAKNVYLYNSNGVLAAKYNWQTVKGNNTFSVKDISGLPAGLYIAEIKSSTGRPEGQVKFIKQH